MIIIKRIDLGIEETVSSILYELKYQPQSEIVFIKPCIPSPCPPDAPYITNYRIVAGVIDYLNDIGIKDIIVGEGPLREYTKTFRISGYETMCNSRGVKLLNLHFTARRTIQWDYGNIELPAIVLDAEYINIAKLKVHTSTTVTLSMKNQMGLLKREDTKRIHQLGLHKPIATLAKVIKPNLIIIDAINGEEGGKPGKHGREVSNINLIICGTLLVETDATAAKIMGFEPQDILHIRIAKEMGIGEFEDKILGEDIDKYKMNFTRLTNHRRICRLYYRWSDETCSGCMSLMEGIRKTALKYPWYLIKFIHSGLIHRVDILTGKPDTIPGTKKGRIIGVGNCIQEIAQRYGFEFVSGCPPKPVDVIRKL